MKRQDVEGKGGQRAGEKEGERSLSYIVITKRRRQSRGVGGEEVSRLGTEDRERRLKKKKKQTQRFDGSHTPKVPQLRRVTNEKRKLWRNRIVCVSVFL